MPLQHEEYRLTLLERANRLPPTPGVYLMRDAQNRIIYVGKSRKLKNRVSQYFRNGEKNAKTARMVSQVARFDYFLCATEMEALALENALIKEHTPKYNIRLKDAKSYPYIKITGGEYPRLVFTRQRLSDKAHYFGPYSGVSVAGAILKTLSKTLRLPVCKRVFPRDIGKERPCLYAQLGRCCAVCTGNVSPEEYNERIHMAMEILRGNTASVRRDIRAEMMKAAEDEMFEKAASLRDMLFALEKISEKQTVIASPDIVEDVFGYYEGDGVSAMSVLYVREGTLLDKDERIFGPDEILDENEALVTFLYEHYKHRMEIPPRILLSFSLEEEDRAMLEESLSAMAGKKVRIHTPERGDSRIRCELARRNAKEKAEAFLRETDQQDKTLVRLATLLSLEVLPQRIESYDISNFGSEHKTCGMIVWENGSFLRSDYRLFHMKTVEGTDDYASMREALARRFSHLSDESGSFSKLPDLILLDGGKTHVAAVKQVAREAGVTVPIFGMVKDDFHKTRALTTESEEISIAHETAVFRMIYRIQDEVHRFSISHMEQAKRNTLKTSALEEISGVGKEKARLLLKHFGGLAAVKRASMEELMQAKGVGPVLARSVFEHFHGKET